MSGTCARAPSGPSWTSASARVARHAPRWAHPTVMEDARACRHDAQLAPVAVAKALRALPRTDTAAVADDAHLAAVPIVRRLVVVVVGVEVQVLEHQAVDARVVAVGA